MITHMGGWTLSTEAKCRGSVATEPRDCGRSGWAHFETKPQERHHRRVLRGDVAAAVTCGCETPTAGSEAIGRQRGALYAALVINLLMFGLELAAGLWAASTALQADSIDMLVDAAGFAVSLFALYRGTRMRTLAGLSNGVLEALLGLAVLAEVGWLAVSPARPIGGVMMSVAGIALIANAGCGLLLMRFRHENINMRAVWLCTRNDAIGNAGTIVAGALVLGLHINWPDLAMGAAIGLLQVRTGAEVAGDALRSLRGPSIRPHESSDFPA